jgi:hypothetical protein
MGFVHIVGRLRSGGKVEFRFDSGNTSGAV